MSEQFYNILTSLGQAEYSSAISLSIPVALTHMVLGDGNGNYYEPSEGQTSLVNEVYRAGLNSVTTDPDNPGWVIAEMVIPSTEGGWYIREAGLISGTGNLFAVGKFPVTYKPLFSEGAGKELVVRLIFEVSNASAITLVVDPTVTIAKVSDIVTHNASETAHEDIRGGADTHNESTTAHNIPTQIATAVGNHNTDVTAHASAGFVRNLKIVANSTVNKLDIFTKSGGAVPDANNVISIAVPDGNGYTIRSRAAAYLSGTSQFILADTAGYWGRTSLNGSRYWACLYAIWDGTGIIWAISRDYTLRNVTTTTTITDLSHMLLEAGSTYTRSASHYCQMVAVFEYEYDTGDSPDHTLVSDSFVICTEAPSYLKDVGKTQQKFIADLDAGELEINGVSLSRTTYARLYTYFGGPIYGYADSSHFYLPNTPGKFARAWAHGQTIDPDRATRTNRGDGTTGDYVGTNQGDAFKSHSHVQNTPDGAGGTFTLQGSGAAGNRSDVSTQATGGTETRPININVMWTIRY